MCQTVRTEWNQGVLRLTLNDPERRNALSFEMLEALRDALGSAAAVPCTRLILLAAKGPAFSAGMDLRRVDLANPDIADRFATTLATIYRTLLHLPVPLLCAVDGPAMGGAVGLALAADLIWAGPGARFALPETKIGLVPALVSVVARRRLAPGNFSALAISGMAVSGAEAHRLGFADFLAAESALAEMDIFAEKLLRENSGEAIARTKRFVAGRDLADLDTELERASREFREAAATASAREGLAAFREKRVVNWHEAREEEK